MTAIASIRQLLGEYVCREEELGNKNINDIMQKAGAYLQADALRRAVISAEQDARATQQGIRLTEMAADRDEGKCDPTGGWGECRDIARLARIISWDAGEWVRNEFALGEGDSLKMAYKLRCLVDSPGSLRHAIQEQLKKAKALGIDLDV